MHENADYNLLAFPPGSGAVALFFSCCSEFALGSCVRACLWGEGGYARVGGEMAEEFDHVRERIERLHNQRSASFERRTCATNAANRATRAAAYVPSACRRMCYGCYTPVPTL